ncbi:MAG: peptidase [Curvibacter sp. GWA2_64_110]|nr:MAG: peptidase [Curvibacter sp. GWA2_64_110]HCY17189.1 peptidase [Curvibacter sp.]
MLGLRERFVVWGLVAGASLLVAGCGSTSLNRAPVEDRRSAASRTVMDPNTQAVKQPPGFENAGKPGYYTVKPGDTLIRVGLETGQNWKDIRRWNNLDNPNQIEVGQVLRVVPPTSSAPATQTAVVTRPIASSTANASSVPPPGQAASAAKPEAATQPEAAANGEDQMAWNWPVNGGSVLAGFDEVKNKGLDLSGTAGDPVFAAADGRVVYAGAGLRGYGNLIILKHNNTYLTAYAHNQALLVKEDQSVRKGQKIAEMGNSDADRVKLHFEVRRQGKPVDPAKYLPAR